MGICNDNSVRYLAKLGYNVVRLPGSHIAPGDVIGVFRGERTLLGSIESMFATRPNKNLLLASNQPAADVTGRTTSKLSLGFSIDILGSIFGAFGASAGLTARYEKAQTIQFRFDKVLRDSVDPLQLGNYVSTGDVAWSNPALEPYLGGGGRLFVIASVIKSKNFGISAESKQGQSLDLDVDALEGLTGTRLKVGRDKTSETLLTFEGDTPLAFGFSCFELAAVGGDKGGKRLAFRPVHAGDQFLSATGGGGRDEPVPAIFNKLGAVDLRTNPAAGERPE